MQSEQALQFGPYRFAPQTGQLWKDTQEVRLTPKAAAVLRYVVARSGQVVTKDELFETVWAETVVSDSALTSCIQEIRQALRDNARKPRYLETIHKRGVRFIGIVVSDQLSVLSQEEVVSSQSVSSREEDEKRQKAKSEDSLESSVQRPASNGQGFDSAMLAQAGIQAPQAPASGEPFWIPAPAGMTQSPATAQNSDPLSQPDQTLDVRHQTLDGSAPTRWWSRRMLIVFGLLLLIGGSGVVYFCSLFLPSPQPLVPSPQLPLPDKPSIAVMPFTNMSGDPEQDYFSDGITDTLITDLSKVSGLFVIARYSVFTYKGKAINVGQIGRELGVRYVLEGSIQKADGHVRINVQLVDARSGGHVWAERYDRPLERLFALQDELMQKIIASLRVEVYEAELQRVRHIPTENLTAYEFVLRGQEALHRVRYENSQAANAQARQLFEQALALDPAYAAASAALAWTYFNDWFNFWNFTPETLEHAATLAQQAVVLDTSVPLSHFTLGWMALWQKKYEQAITEHEQAIALDPNWADAYAQLGYALASVGRPEEGIEVITKAMRLNPRYPNWYLNLLGSAYRNAGRYEEALIPLQQAVARNPDYGPAHVNLAICFAYLGRQQEAESEGAKILQIWPTYELEIDRQTLPYKNPADLERYLDGLRKAGLK